MGIWPLLFPDGAGQADRAAEPEPGTQGHKWAPRLQGGGWGTQSVEQKPPQQEPRLFLLGNTDTGSL